MSPGIIANPFAAGIGRKNSLESISSIDRDLSPEELEVLQKVGVLAVAGRVVWNGILVKCQAFPRSITSSGLCVYGVSSSQHTCQRALRRALTSSWGCRPPCRERERGETWL